MTKNKLAKLLKENVGKVISCRDGNVIEYNGDYCDSYSYAVVPRRFMNPSDREVEEGLTQFRDYATLYRSGQIMILHLWNGEYRDKN